MQGSLKRLVSRFRGGQKGFTLIEMIVVVGIIAVLAAVIVPNMGRFIGQGEEGAQSAERDAVQTAMKAMMADKSIITVTASVTNSSQMWDALPVGTGASVLLPYLQSEKTQYFYCWDGDGDVAIRVDKVETAC